MDAITMGTTAHQRDAARQARLDIRAGKWQSLTSGMAPGMVQGNLVILPRDWAAEFQLFCRLNPKPCPLIAMTRPGDPAVPELGEVIASKAAGRTRDDQITVADLTGTGVQDTAIAILARTRAEAAAAGTSLDS